MVQEFKGLWGAAMNDIGAGSKETGKGDTFRWGKSWKEWCGS